jgi:hypothetical protein
MKQDTINDADRWEWIRNDEGLYDWFRTSRQSKTAFVRSHRAEIDEVIRNVRDSVKPAHYLKYGG